MFVLGDSALEMIGDASIKHAGRIREDVDVEDDICLVVAPGCSPVEVARWPISTARCHPDRSHVAFCGA